MTTFTVNQKELDNGTYSVEELKQFSLNTDSNVLIRNVAIIINGKITKLCKG